MKNTLAIARALSLLLSLMIPLTLIAQAQSIPFSIEPRISSTRSIVSLGDQWSETTTRTNPELVIVGLIDRNWRLRYSLVPAYRFESHVLNANSFVINGIQFREIQQGQGSQGQTNKEQKPITLSWHHGMVNRLELMPMINSTLRPVISGQWVNASLTATGERDSKPVEATETWRAFLWGAGANLRVVGDGRACEVQLCAGDRLTRAEGTLMVWVSSGISVSGGYSWERWRIGEMTVEQRAPFVGIVGSW